MNLLLDEVARATERLAEAGVPSPRHDAEELAAAIHDVPRAELHRVPDAEFDAVFWAAVARRAAREPLQHITGRAFFRYLELAVGPGVFVPRPETEVVVGWAIDALRAMDVAEPVVVDLCAGSGAIALAVAQEVPRSQVHAVEVDDVALKWARRNLDATADRLLPGSAGDGRPATATTAGSRGRRSRVALHHADVTGCLPELNGQVDLVISNPPYVPLDATIRDPEVSEYDPPVALWSGTDGLDMIRLVEATARRLLKPTGVVVVEHADEQWGSAPAVFHEDHGWTDIRDHRDLGDRPRFTTARYRPA